MCSHVRCKGHHHIWSQWLVQQLAGSNQSEDFDRCVTSFVWLPLRSTSMFVDSWANLIAFYLLYYIILAKIPIRMYIHTKVPLDAVIFVQECLSLLMTPIALPYVSNDYYFTVFLYTCTGFCLNILSALYPSVPKGVTGGNCFHEWQFQLAMPNLLVVLIWLAQFKSSIHHVVKGIWL